MTYKQDLQAGVSSLHEPAARDVWGLGSTLMVAFSHANSTFSACQPVRNDRARDQMKKKKVAVEVKKHWFPPSCWTTDDKTALFPHGFPRLLQHDSSRPKDHLSL